MRAVQITAVVGHALVGFNTFDACWLSARQHMHVTAAHLRLNPVKELVCVVWCRQAHWLLVLDAVRPQVFVLQGAYEMAESTSACCYLCWQQHAAWAG